MSKPVQPVNPTHSILTHTITAHFDKPSMARRVLSSFLLLVVALLVPALAFVPLPRLPSNSPRASQCMSMSASSPSSSQHGPLSTRRGSLAGTATAGVVAALLLSSSSAPTPAWAGVKASSVEEAQKAAREVKASLAYLTEMQKAAANADWQTVKTLLEKKEFKNFENTATTLVRCDCLTAEDKTSLGTIRRFGLTADFIITLGGLEGELRSGGVLPPIKGMIVEESDDEEGDGEKNVNRGEALKFARLARAAMQEIDKITSQVLPENEQ